MVETLHPAGRTLLFRYRAVELATGRLRCGEQGGDSPFAVRASLRRIGLQVESITPVDGTVLPRWLAALATPLQEILSARRRRRHRAAKADICDGLATLIQAGVPLEQAVASLAGSSARSTGERRMLRSLRDHLREGASCSQACAAHPDWYDRFDLAIIEAGQQAGDLAAMLGDLARHHQRAGALGQKLFVALAYPVVLLVAGLAVLEFMSLGTLPQLVALIEQAKRTPPWLTTTLISLGQGFAHWWPLVVLGVAGVVAALRWSVERIPVESPCGRWWHGNPLARMRSRVRVAQVAQSLARLRHAGLPLTDALLVVADTAHDRALRRLLGRSVEAIRRGEDLSAAIAGSRLLDPEFAQLLQLGERSGELTGMLERIAERYQRAAEDSTERLAAVLGPLAIIILAGLIGTLVMACIQPLMQMGDLV